MGAWQLRWHRSEEYAYVCRHDVAMPGFVGHFGKAAQCPAVGLFLCTQSGYQYTANPHHSLSGNGSYCCYGYGLLRSYFIYRTGSASYGTLAQSYSQSSCAGAYDYSHGCRSGSFLQLALHIAYRRVYHPHQCYHSLLRSADNPLCAYPQEGDRVIQELFLGSPEWVLKF